MSPVQRRVEQMRATQNRCRAWLKRSQLTPKEWRPRKKKRVQACQWLQALEHQLLHASEGQAALETLRCKDGTDPFEWRHLSVASDQGPDAVAAIAWAQRSAKLSLDVCWDLSHLASNSWKEGMRKAGLMLPQRLMTMAWNARHGPWQEGTRWGQASDAVAQHVELLSATTCPLFQDLLPHILDERGEGHRRTEPGIEEVVWQELQEGFPWRRRGTPVSDTRFFATVRESRSEDQQWHHRLLGYTLACLELDLLKGAKLEKIAFSVPVGAKQTMQSASASDEAGLRKICGNLLVMATMMYGSSEHRLLQRLVVAVSSPLEEWHGMQNKALRSASATVPWLTDQLLHQGPCQVISDTWQVLQQGSALDRMGFTLIYDVPGGQTWRKTHGEDVRARVIEDEDVRAEHAGDLSLYLAGAFLHRTAWMHRGWPARSVLLLDPGARHDTLQALQRDFDNFEKLIQEDRANLEYLRTRSLFQIRPVQHLCRCLKVEGWKVTGRMQSTLATIHTRVMATQAIEDGFHTCRDTETKALSKQAVSRTCYEKLLSSAVLTKRHHFQVPSIEGIPTPRAERIPDEYFKANWVLEGKPHLREEPLPYMNIIGFGAPNWYSSRAQDLPVPHADCSLLDLASTYGQTHLLPNAWLNMFFQGHHLLVRRKKPVEGPWCFVLGSVPGSASMVWEAVEVEVKSAHHKVFEPAVGRDKARWEVILDLKDWEALSLTWRSPLWQVWGQDTDLLLADNGVFFGTGMPMPSSAWPGSGLVAAHGG